MGAPMSAPRIHVDPNTFEPWKIQALTHARLSWSTLAFGGMCSPHAGASPSLSKRNYVLGSFATIYVDFFRGVPSILIIYVLGFGVPALQLDGVPKEPFFWALVTLVLKSLLEWRFDLHHGRAGH